MEVRDAASAADLGPALDARRGRSPSAAAAFVLGLLGTLVGSRARPALDRREWVPRAGNALLAALALAGLVAVLVAIGNPSDWVNDRWDDFKTSGYSAGGVGTDALHRRPGVEPV